MDEALREMEQEQSEIIHTGNEQPVSVSVQSIQRKENSLRNVTGKKSIHCPRNLLYSPFQQKQNEKQVMVIQIKSFVHLFHHGSTTEGRVEWSTSRSRRDRLERRPKHDSGARTGLSLLDPPELLLLPFCRGSLSLHIH